MDKGSRVQLQGQSSPLEPAWEAAWGAWHSLDLQHCQCSIHLPHRPVPTAWEAAPGARDVPGEEWWDVQTPSPTSTHRHGTAAAGVGRREPCHPRAV